MNLRTLFAIPIAVVVMMALSLAGMIASQGWSARERGQAAVEAVERMRLLLLLQSDLRVERVASNLALGKDHPLPEGIARQVANARRDTDREISAVVAKLRDRSDLNLVAMPPQTHVMTVIVRLASLRASIDGLLARPPGERAVAELDTIMPRGLEVAEVLDAPVERAGIALAAADPGLAGLVTEDRLAASMRDQVGLIAAVLLPRFGKGEPPTTNDLDKVEDLADRAMYLTHLIDDSIEIAGATEQIRLALAGIRKIDVGVIISQLKDPANIASGHNQDSILPPMPQRVLVPWGMRINTLRTAMLDAMVERVTKARIENERQFDFVLVACGAILVGVLESITLLSQRVVRPIAQLGVAISRIAAGDRSVQLAIRSGTQEINEMVTAVETLRQAALVADATALRQRMLARHRLELLREALGIVQSVEEPAHALERGVASLSEGIDATIALIHQAAAAPPPTLGVAANAVRQGLAEMRQSAAELDATFARASGAQAEDRPQAEFVAHIRAVEMEVERRNVVVRGFVQPSLVALRDAASATGKARTPALNELVRDQFQRLESTVAIVASMRAAVTRAAEIIRELPLDDEPIAA